jgi:hypothetical protein
MIKAYSMPQLVEYGSLEDLVLSGNAGTWSDATQLAASLNKASSSS